MKFEYTLTLDDYMAARRLGRRNQPALFLAHFIALRCIPVLGLFVAAYSIHWILGNGHRSSLSGPIGFILLMFLMFFFGERFFASGAFSRISLSAATKSIDIGNDENLILLWSAESKVQEIPWAAFIDFKYDRQVSLLYVKKNKFLFVPTKMLAENQRDELNEAISRRVKKKG